MWRGNVEAGRTDIAKLPTKYPTMYPIKTPTNFKEKYINT
jgi:hypothetical protein